MSFDAATMPFIPVSWGELLDKISILEIKAGRIADPVALSNVRRELALLHGIAAPVLDGSRVAGLVEDLRTINRTLWEVEDDIRRKEAAGEFDDAFVQLARAVYRTNDRRSAVKREINRVLGSTLVEEKLHPATSSGLG